MRERGRTQRGKGLDMRAGVGPRRTDRVRASARRG